MIEISPWLMYWLMQLDKICAFIDVIAVLGSLSLAGLIIIRTAAKVHARWSREDEELLNSTASFCRFSSIIVPIFVLLNVFVPNTKTVAAMILVPPITNNEQVQQIPEDILTFVRSVLKEYTLDNKEK